ncbi:hypothetical protein EJ110_NYTH54821, partial [Nymphaea thermarum]
MHMTSSKLRIAIMTVHKLMLLSAVTKTAVLKNCFQLMEKLIKKKSSALLYQALSLILIMWHKRCQRYHRTVQEAPLSEAGSYCMLVPMVSTSRRPPVFVWARIYHHEKMRQGRRPIS